MKASKIFSMVFAAMFILTFTATKTFASTAVNWSRQMITVTGIGFAPAGNFPPLQTKLLAKRAAVNEAYRQLAEAVNGVKVTGETTVSAMTLVSDIIKTKVEATIKNVQPVSERELRDGGYEVKMQMPLFGSTNSLAGIIFEKPKEKIPFPEPVMNVAPTVPTYTSRTPISQRIEIVVNGANNVNIITKSVPSNYAVKYMANENIPAINQPVVLQPQIKMPEVKIPKVPQVTAPTIQTSENTADLVSTAKVEGNYTGLIIDCRELDLQPVMSPTIQTDSEQTIYGDKNLDYDKIIEFGMVSYSTDVNDSITEERAGKNPIVVKATGLKNFNSCPVIQTADSNRILIENKVSKFLDNLSVVFIM